jgi:hypothetical protein
MVIYIYLETKTEVLFPLFSQSKDGTSINFTSSLCLKLGHSSCGVILWPSYGLINEWWRLVKRHETTILETDKNN